MAYIPYTDAPDYHAEVERQRGMVGNILRVHGIEPEVGRAHLELYATIMFGRSTVTRLEREAIAVAVSTANRYHY